MTHRLHREAIFEVVKMSQAIRVEEIKSAVTHLPLSELIDFGKWFRRFEAQIWDAQIEADIRSGRLDQLAAEALADFEANRCTAFSH